MFVLWDKSKHHSHVSVCFYPQDSDASVWSRLWTTHCVWKCMWPFINIFFNDWSSLSSIWILLWILFSQGESVIDCFEVNSSEPFLSQGSTDSFSWCSCSFSCFMKLISVCLSLSVSHCLTDVSTRGVALVPKLALDVSCCEVLRLMQLTDNFIVPISYQVPRKVRMNTSRSAKPTVDGKAPKVLWLSYTSYDW